MIVRAAEMARDVRVAIDMNRGDKPLLLEEDCDTLSLDEIIISKLADAVRLVEMEAPLSMLESGHDLFGNDELSTINDQRSMINDERLTINDELSTGATGREQAKGVFWGDEGNGYIILPEDFMRLICFRMSDWRRSVYEALTESDPRYALQSSKWKGVRGNPEKPVVAIVRRPEGKVLEFYSCGDSTATVAHATYLPYPRIDKDGGIDIAEECYRAAVYRAAALALASLGDQLSATMLEISRSLMHNA